MWAIIRFSVNNENNSALRNKLRDALKTHIRLKENTGTYRTWRKRGITEKEMALVLKGFGQQPLRTKDRVTWTIFGCTQSNNPSAI